MGGSSPRERIGTACETLGRDAVIDGCIDLLEGRSADPRLVLALGGPPGRWVLTGAPPGPDYWLRVWAARGLLWAWDDRASRAILMALRDDSWRVRELACKVVARHVVDSALEWVAALQQDPVARVRNAASRALAQLTAS